MANWRSRIGLAVAMVGVAVVGGVGLTLFTWTIDETRFERPSAAFDALAAEIAAAPGVAEVQKERWVEAPTFSNTSSWVYVIADAGALTNVLNVACETSYPDPVSWGVDLTTHGGTRVSTTADAGHGCPELGFNLPPVVAELDRILPGSTIHAAAWDAQRFTLASFEGSRSKGISDLLPLVDNADILRAAADIDPTTVVEVSAPLLSVDIRRGESAEYHTLLTQLVDDYNVTGFFAGGGGQPIDGIEKVQITAPHQHHTAIEQLIATSGLPVADLPVSFLN